MSKACQLLHERISALSAFTGTYNPTDLPTNGIYFVFETGETAHGGRRIVRIGTHTGDNNLQKRINEHLYTPNKDRSVFRKHLGRCILNVRKDPALSQWEIDLTPSANRDNHFTPAFKEAQDKVEAEVSDYITKNLSFAVLEVEAGQMRLQLESSLLATIAQCKECEASGNWLGRNHPNRLSFGTIGLWNVQGLKGPPMTEREVEMLQL
ncbi:hypothetical protein [Mesorhizobium sp.]|uniref:hypothetical protein n=1 Tax=Mesorhizobium sp. TaxID=1871066 RepID=UPI000FE7A4BA|nr:hypothetical protein [Mesorhizobium sp.]RWN37529.1 MAG: hypothetical protein EOR95_04910 [Mesorhizobium sp.]